MALSSSMAVLPSASGLPRTPMIFGIRKSERIQKTVLYRYDSAYHMLASHSTIGGNQGSGSAIGFSPRHNTDQSPTQQNLRWYPHGNSGERTSHGWVMVTARDLTARMKSDSVGRSGLTSGSAAITPASKASSITRENSSRWPARSRAFPVPPGCRHG